MASTRKDYTGEQIVVSFDRKLCIHAANCIRGLPQVFDLDARPWIAADGAPADEIAQVVERCPSGALQYHRLDGFPDEATGERYVYPIPNGPLFVHGAMEVLDAEGNVIRSDVRMTLCRCGGSSNKPFCDNTHRTNGWRTE
jgi:uncharacterized Fe-S cluster protein YjdI